MTLSRARIAFALVAAIAGVGELVFLAANARTFGSVLRSLWWTSAYFTDWTGGLVAVVCTAVVLNWRGLASPYWLGLATVAAGLVGAMFAWLGGWGQLGQGETGRLYELSNVLSHALAPPAMLLAWLVAVEHGGLKWRDAALFMLFPLAYLAQMFARGAMGYGYPYVQMDVAQVGWGQALQFAAAMTFLFLALGLLLVALDRLLTKRVVERPMSRVLPASVGGPASRGDGEAADG